MADPQQESRAALSGMGFNCLSSDRRLVESSVALSDMPVMLLPARDKLFTRPVATGSPAPKATTVAMPTVLAARATGKPLTTNASNYSRPSGVIFLFGR
jgi:hypothetical protein